jgi:C4-dicarboxylate transporter
MVKQIKRLSLYISTLIILGSCSAHYHVIRAIKKGYVCDETSDTIQVSTIDSIPYVLRDSIYWEKVIVQKDTIVRYKASFVPKTRFLTRIEYKYKTKYIKAEAQKVKYQNKYITKYKTRWLFVIIAFIVGFLVRLSISETFRSRLKLLTKL